MILYVLYLHELKNKEELKNQLLKYFPEANYVHFEQLSISEQINQYRSANSLFEDLLCSYYQEKYELIPTCDFCGVQAGSHLRSTVVRRYATICKQCLAKAKCYII